MTQVIRLHAEEENTFFFVHSVMTSYAEGIAHMCCCVLSVYCMGAGTRETVETRWSDGSHLTELMFQEGQCRLLNNSLHIGKQAV